MAAWTPEEAQTCRNPCVLVTTSPGAEAIATKTHGGASCTELLGQFSRIDELGAKIKTVHESYTHTLRKLTLRFIHSTQLCQPDSQAASAEVQQIITAAGEDPVTLTNCPKVRTKEDVAGAQATLESASTHWVDKYREAFQHTLRCGEHEFFDQPVAHILLLGSTEVDSQKVADAFRGLQERTVQPAILAEQIYDASIPVFFAVLHENSTDGSPQSPDWLAAINNSLQSTYGSGCSQLLVLSSASWRHELNEFMKKFASSFVVPCMERKVRTLHANIAALRRGFKNQWKTWFGGQRPASEREGVTLIEGRPPLYAHIALEAQMRQFSDLVFMLGDYDLALQNYRLVCAEYKKDRAMKCAAAALEMTAICLVLMSGSQREAEQCFMEAMQLYQRERATPYASRVAFLLYDCLQKWNRPLDASKVLMTASDHEAENNARAAIMLELAGQCFLKMQPAQYRKYAFHLVLSGYRYNLAQQRRHTVRCYSTALYLYQQNGWSHIEDHLNFSLGRQHKSLRHYGESMRYLIDLLSECQQPAERQEAFLKEFMQVTDFEHRQNPVQSVSLDIPIPAVQDNTVQVRMNEIVDQSPPLNNDGDADPLLGADCSQRELPSQPTQVRTNSDGGLSERGDFPVVNETSWADMQNGLEHLYSVVRQSAGGRAKSGTSGKSSQCCYVGEPVLIEMQLWNPVKVVLPISELQLVYNFEADGAGPVGTAGDSSSVQVVSIGVELMPQALTHVQLRLVPLVKGRLKVTGVRWLLLGKIQCHHDFKLQGPRLNTTKQQRKAAKPVYAKDSRLELQVCDAMPLLRVENLSADIVHSDCSRYVIRTGELRQIKMRLSNIGRTANMESVTVAVSLPEMFFFDDQDINAGAATFEREQPRETVSTLSSDSAIDLAQNHSIATLIAGDAPGVRHRLAPSQAADFSVWLYGPAEPGLHSIGLLFYYDADPAHPSSNFRLMRHTICIDVQPGVNISVIAAAPVPMDLASGEDRNDHQLTVEVANNSSVSMHVLQLGCLSSAYRIAKNDSKLDLHSASVDSLQRLEPGQKQWLHFRIVDMLTECGLLESVDDQRVQKLFHTTVDLSATACSETGALTLDRVAWTVLCRQDSATVGWLRAMAVHGEIEVSAQHFLLGLLARPSSEIPSGGGRIESGVSLPLARGLLCAQASSAPALERSNAYGTDCELDTKSSSLAHTSTLSRRRPLLGRPTRPTQQWSGRRILLDGPGGGWEAQEAKLVELEADRVRKELRKMDELKMMANKNKARGRSAGVGGSGDTAIRPAPPVLCPIEYTVSICPPCTASDEVASNPVRGSSSGGLVLADWPASLDSSSHSGRPKERGLCTARLTIQLRNKSPSFPLSVTFNALAHDGKSALQTALSPMWAGATLQHLELPPRALERSETSASTAGSDQFCIDAVFASSGVYDLGCVHNLCSSYSPFCT